MPLPDLCSHGSECLSEEGCYIARIQRKVIRPVKLHKLYLVKAFPPCIREIQKNAFGLISFAHSFCTYTVLKRGMHFLKEIISLDAKYMIKIAEARGLFGNELGQKKSSTVKMQKKRDDQQQRSGSAKGKSRKVKVGSEEGYALILINLRRKFSGGDRTDNSPDAVEHSQDEEGRIHALRIHRLSASPLSHFGIREQSN